MNYKKLSTNHNSIYCFINRLWRRKFLLISLILLSLIVTILLMNSKLNLITSLFSSYSSSFSNKLQLIAQLQKQQNDNKLKNEESYHPKNYLVDHHNPNDQHSSKDNYNNKVNNNLNNNNNNNNDNQIPSQIFINSGSILKSYNGYIPKKRFVHLDLKGAPPKISFLKQLFPLLRKAGANGLLLEYEDVFPYDGELKFAVADNAYTKQDIEEIKSSAKENNLEIIPLVQTLGHLEFFLKLKEYRHLRESDEFPQAICPSKNESYSLLTQMIDQILAMHPETKRLHIGCDEVFQIGQCPLCRSKDRDDIFLSHVKRIATYLKKFNVIPIIWDDMLRQIPFVQILQTYELDKLGVELMIWTYVDDIYRFIPESTWQTYSQTFPKIWGASAFKGAFGETLTVPNIKMHLENNRAWLRVMEEQDKNFNSINGLVVTGWQRYDHLATLCELLPSGLPSLILNLLTISNGKYSHRKIMTKYYDLLNCTEREKYHLNENLLKSDPNFFHVSNCQFPGSTIFHLMEEFDQVDKKINDYLYDVTIHKAWLTDYNFRHNITNPWRIYEGLQEYNHVMYSVKSLIKQALNSLRQVYDDSTVYEWIEEKIYPQYLRLEKFYNQTKEIRKFRVWPKRPIKPYADLLRVLNENI